MKRFGPFPVRTLLVLTVITGLVVTIAMLPFSIASNTASAKSVERGLPNFDIRLQHDDRSTEVLSSIRERTGKSAAAVAAMRSEIANGEIALRSRMPGVVVEYNDHLGNAEVISPNVWDDKAELLSAAGAGDRAQTLKDFIKDAPGLVGLDARQVDDLAVTADYTNPDGNLSFTHLEQRINAVPVFAGEVKAGFDSQGRMVRIINNTAPGLSYELLSSSFGDPADAVRAASAHINLEETTDRPQLNAKESTDLRAVFGEGDWATTAEKMYFPTEPGVAVPAWRVLIWQEVDAYYVIVDAASGAMLWRKNIGEDQTQSATYNVYRNANSYLDVADSPAPFSPGPTSPNGQQAPVITRQNVTLVGNEGTLSFNNKGWITDGTNITDGNFTAAGVDRGGTNGIDATQVGSPNRTFTSTWNPPPGNPSPGDGPLTTQAQRGAVIQMFYVMNRYHDELYKRGFTEPARNFQHENFGRGGAANDRVSSEGQDSSGTNNANFFTPADGSRPRMQMYIWTGPNPDYDGTADADIIIHEVTHGLSNRLHGNTAGLSTNMSRGMGEGWGDWYAHTMLAEPTDPIEGIYSLGGYATYLGSTGYTSNYYHGIRRFPKAVISFVGPNGKPHNPLTFRHLNSNCNTEIGSTSTIGTISAYRRGPFGVSQCDAVHNAGEIWSSALWEVRALMIARLGFTAGTERVLQVVTDGMKLAPSGPTFLQERDAIISAAQSFSTADADDVREGFRRRGMGYGASIQSTSPASVTESFAVWPGAPTPTPTPTTTATPTATPTVTPSPTPSPTVTPTPSPTPEPGVTISGFVRKANGKGLAGATVTLQGGPSGTVTTTSGGSAGSYSFTNVETGFNYTVTASANRYNFTPTSHSIFLTTTVTNLNFIGDR